MPRRRAALRSMAVIVVAVAPAAGVSGEPAGGPVAPEGQLTVDLSLLDAPGRDEDGATRGLLEVGVGVDLERLLGWRGASAFVGALAVRGDNGSELLGDAQGYSNIDSDEMTNLAEAWVEQRLARQRVRIKLGRIDANDDFAVAESALDFINSSAGYSPTILPLPTYPDPRPGLAVFGKPVERLRVAGGAFAMPARRDRDLFLIGELTAHWHRGSSRFGRGKISIGGWRHQAAGGDGTYVVIEQALRSPDVAAFAQIGHTHEAIDDFHRHFGAGVTFASPFRRDRGDRLGLMLSEIELNGPAGEGGGRETVIEAFVRLRLPAGIAVQPDLQFIDDPAGDREAGHALVLSVRLQVGF